MPRRLIGKVRQTQRMDAPLDPTQLYADVAAYGSLGAALQAVASAAGISLDVVASERQPLHSATVPSATPLRKGLGITAGAVERVWIISGWSQGISSISGSTTDLAEVVKAAQAWSGGAPLRDIQLAAPFVEVTRRGEAAELGPEYIVTGEWDRLLREADEANWPEYRALIMAAYAEPRLRQLYPYTSHWMLRFSTTTGYPFSPDIVCLTASEDSTFTVRENWMGPTIGTAATAEEAVLIAADLPPPGLGAAIAGPYLYED
ncbi:hypothetical protein F4553_001796 [Allocatelliglobosispora scoriae]|uniref:Uncharacterized protein n=1 Tax=Allocatelliglobosispora scoriae TaxID=643052 RepID=A0A841BH59_9ACTN|nr:DUF6193 family natural product biosynthesis protein [Allocatelliglobosispora scoriae]MBB5868417.1 hypothetical protein [Allocatelliglobosispora scoriae]